ncbi:DDE_3 domain-containing protein [Trichonephila clavipes]|uniref:DDE_3 domain-containing protein n=1 Tax=Trichonephila clavipes TaxID=2585209 RepID=A0A8X6UV00_TRICX|nr:DDE_3 domain-containing protein [Trichonephila clavipes]
MGAEFLFMDDNARPRLANIVDECLQSKDITRMDWPAYSPDLNPIEHVWDMLGRRIAARQSPPTCLPELRRTLLDEWCNIPQDQIDNLILSMPRRCAQGLLATDLVILNHGRVTRPTPELASAFPNFRTTPTRGRLSLDLTRIGPICTTGHKARTHDTPATSR